MGMTVYRIEKTDGGRSELFIVENNADELPRRAAYQQLGFNSDEFQNSKARPNLASKAQCIHGELDTITLVASAMLDSLKAVKLSELVLEFGVSLGGMSGVPLLTRGDRQSKPEGSAEVASAKVGSSCLSQQLHHL